MLIDKTIKDSALLSDSTELTELKQVLADNFGISTEALLGSVQELEDRRENRTDIALNLPIATKERLEAILSADGVEISDTTKANWIENVVDAKYVEYLQLGNISEGTE